MRLPTSGVAVDVAQVVDHQDRARSAARPDGRRRTPAPRACRSARTSSRRRPPGRRRRRRRPRRARGSRRAAGRRCRPRPRRCRPRPRRPATSSTAPRGRGRRRAATAKARPAATSTCARGGRAGADQPHRADPVGVGAAHAVGVVVGVVDRRPAAPARRPARAAPAPGRKPSSAAAAPVPTSTGATAAGRVRGPGAGDPLGGGGHQTSGISAATARRSGLPVCRSGTVVDQVQLARGGGRAEPVRRPRRAVRRARAAPRVGDDGGDHPLPPLVVGPAEHDRVGDRRVVAQRRLDRAPGRR